MKKNTHIQNGKKVNKKSQLSTEQIKAAVVVALNDCGGEILAFAKFAYSEYGRGCVNICVKNHPNVPYKRGYYDYVTEEDNKVIQANQTIFTENDRKITESIRSYDPNNQAVVCVWHETMYFITTLTDIFAVFDTLDDRSDFAGH